MASSSAPPRRHYLYLVSRNCSFSNPALIVLDHTRKSRVVVGRQHDKVDHVVDSRRQPNMISRQHAELFYDAAKRAWVVSDHVRGAKRASINGISVNDKRVRKAVLREGDFVVFGGAGNLPVGAPVNSTRSEFRYMFTADADFGGAAGRAAAVATAAGEGEEDAGAGSSSSAAAAAAGQGGRRRLKRKRNQLAEAGLTDEMALLEQVRFLTSKVRQMEEKAAKKRKTGDKGEDGTQAAAAAAAAAQASEKLREQAEAFAQLKAEQERLKAENADAMRKLREKEEALAREEAEKQAQLGSLQQVSKNAREREAEAAEARKMVETLQLEREKLRKDTEVLRLEQEKQAELAEQRRLEMEAQAEAARAKMRDMQEQIAEREKAVEASRAAVQEIEEEVTCSVCQEIFVDSVLLRCSHSFCSECIEGWLSRRDTCPMCNALVTAKPTRNVVLNNSVTRLVEKMNEDTRSDYAERQQEHQQRKDEDKKKVATLRRVLGKVKRRNGAGQFHNITGNWTARERNQFREGVKKYPSGEARHVYCDLVGLSSDFCQSASEVNIDRACRNLGIRTEDADDTQKRCRLLLFTLYGCERYFGRR